MQSLQYNVAPAERVMGAPSKDKVTATQNCGNPFDLRTCGREAFPSIEAALADGPSSFEAEEKDVGSALDWSIDTLAELKPIAFSPLPQQKNPIDAFCSPNRTSDFFEDEMQYDVLRTPLSCTQTAREVSPAAGNRTSIILTPSPPMKLSQCRSEMTSLRQVTAQKRHCAVPQRRLKRSPRRWSADQRVALPSRSTARQFKNYRPKEVEIPQWKSPKTRPPKWSASPIGMVGNRQQHCALPATPHFGVLTPSPLVQSTKKATFKKSLKLRLSFGLSPVSNSCLEADDATSGKFENKVSFPERVRDTSSPAG